MTEPSARSRDPVQRGGTIDQECCGKRGTPSNRRTEARARPCAGTGFRLLECLTLCLKDVDMARRGIVVRWGEGDKDRVTMLPAVLDALGEHLGTFRTAAGSAGAVQPPCGIADRG